MTIYSFQQVFDVILTSKKTEWLSDLDEIFLIKGCDGNPLHESSEQEFSILNLPFILSELKFLTSQISIETFLKISSENSSFLNILKCI